MTSQPSTSNDAPAPEPTKPRWRELESAVNECLQSDRHRLRTLLRSARQLAEKKRPFDRKLAQFEELRENSQRIREKRLKHRPAISYDEALPVSGRREEIARAIAEHQVVVVCGETGSGKSTQLPKICLEMGRGIDGLIGHTQPRRIAARSVAERVAEELGSKVGEHVGYKVRFTDATSPRSYIKLMTDGILLAESQHDRFLDAYDTIIIDEAHERSLNIDFLLGYLKRLLPKRPRLRVIITSATLDAERFAEHFGDSRGPAPIIEVSGRTYPVEVVYRPPEPDPESDEPDWLRAMVSAAEELAEIDSGDMLIFMPTERDIHEAAKLLRAARLAGDGPGLETEILPLYARLSSKDQHRVFESHRWRRIVISTNVAESSLTVPGIRYVIDSGLARLSRYSARSGIQRLPIEAVSRASADQRKGRCGRVGPGVCVRLYDEQDYESRPQYTPPEIQRTNLASVILQALVLNFGAIEEFPFLDPPRADAIRDGYQTLFELGAVDENHQVTELGRRLGRLPVDPRIGRMILAADEQACLHEVLIIASALEVQDPRERPLEKQAAADAAHEKFADGESDFLSYLKMWDFYHKLKEDLSRNQLKKACHQNFLNLNRLREWADVQRQLRQLVEDGGLKVHPRKDDYTNIHQALLTGLLTKVAFRSDANEYTAAGDQKAALWPGSSTYAKKPKWIVAGELVETTRRYLRTVARINPNWIEPLAGHLVKRTYSDPHWVRDSGTVMAYEKVALQGLIIVPRRAVRYGPIDPAMARTLFIQHALVEGDFDSQADFFKHNQELLAEVEDLQAKSRRRDLLLGEQARYQFYDRRLPDDVYDAQTLNKWLPQASKSQPSLLLMQRSDLMREERAETVEDSTYPERLRLQGIELPLEYNLQPGSDDDGITISVPEEGLAQLDAQRLGWLVPGLLEEKVAALIKTLPKPIRRNFVPANDTARKIVPLLKFGEGSLVKAVADVLSRLSSSVVVPEAFELDRLPRHLQMNIRVVDDQGQPVASSRDLGQLREKFGVAAEALPASAFGRGTAARPRGRTPLEIRDETYHIDGATDWAFGELPAEVRLSRGGMELVGFPTLVDQGNGVGLRLYSQPEVARATTRGGLRRLVLLSAVRKELKTQLQHLPQWSQSKLFGATLPDAGRLDAQVLERLADRALPDITFNDSHQPCTEDEFRQFLKRAKAGVGPAVQEVAPVLGPLLQHYHQARLAIEQSPGRDPKSQWHYAISDLQEQLDELIVPGFLVTTPWNWLRNYPRYFQAMRQRLQRLAGGGLQKDRAITQQIRARWQAYRHRRDEQQKRNIHDPELDQFRWMLEEYRVSHFAQALGTAVPVSEKRLDKQWQKTRVE